MGKNKKKVLISGIWFQASKLIQFAFNFAISIILARILTPDIFGLAGIVTLITTLFSNFVMYGITHAIIQQKNLTQQQLSSIFWFNLALGSLAYFILLISIPLLVKFYNEPLLKQLISILGVSFIIAPLFQVHRRMQEKNLQFNNIAKIEVITAIGSGVTAIILALKGAGVFSIVVQSATLSLFYFISTIYFYKWKPDLFFNFQEIREIFWYSVKVRISKLINILQRNIDFILLSKLFTLTQYGIYSLAYRIMYFPVRRIANSTSEILFPAFSLIQDDFGKLKKNFLKALSVILLVIIPISIFLLFYSNELVFFILGDKWEQIAGILFILSVAGAFQTIESIADNIYLAIGKPSKIIYLEIIRTILTAIAIIIGYKSGLIFLAYSIAITRFLLLIITLIMLEKIVNIKIVEILTAFFKPLLCAVLLSSIIILINYLFNTPSSFSLIVKILISGIGYLVMCYFLNKPLAKELLIIFNKKIN